MKGYDWRQAAPAIHRVVVMTAPDRTFLGWVGDIVTNAALAVTARLVASLLTRSVCHVRPDLNPAQQTLLRTHFEAAFAAFFEGHTNISRHIRGMLSVICYDMPESNRDELFQQLVQILSTFDLHGFLEDEPDAVVYNDYEEDEGFEHDPNYDILVSRLMISRDLAKPIPRCVRSALVAELTRTPPPTCSITLEEIVDGRGRIAGDVIALVQKIPNSSSRARDRFHVFLYKRAALEHWFEVGGDVNPLTRERIHRSSQLFPLSG